MTTRVPTAFGLIDVGTTTLYYEMQGNGAPLLLISGGGDDAGQWSRVAPALGEWFTVVTYDRRGLSRSPRPEGWTVTSMDEQAADAAALLQTLDLAPAMVVGHSGGASISCALVARHPNVVRSAVIYEPPLFAVLPNNEDVVGGFQTMVDDALAEGGPAHAMELFIRANAGDEAYETWLATASPAYRERLLGNAATFFSTELPAFVGFVPDRDRMRASDVPLTVVVGEDNRNGWIGDAVRWLVAGTGASLVELPGGHGGFLTHQEAFVALIRRLGLAASTNAPKRVRT